MRPFPRSYIYLGLKLRLLLFKIKYPYVKDILSLLWQPFHEMLIVQGFLLLVGRGFTRLLSEETLYFLMSHSYFYLPNSCLSFSFIMIMKCRQDRASHLNSRTWIDTLLSLSKEGKLTLPNCLSEMRRGIVKQNRHQLGNV